MVSESHSGFIFVYSCFSDRVGFAGGKLFDQMGFKTPDISYIHCVDSCFFYLLSTGVKNTKKFFDICLNGKD